MQNDLIPQNPIFDDVEYLDDQQPGFDGSVVEAKPLPKTHIIHHRDCDGYLAGAIAMASLQESGREFTMTGVQYGEPFPELELKEDTRVIILDFSYKREILEDINSKVESLLVLDHHESAMQELEGLPYAHFDMTKSGCLLAWEHFVPEYAPSRITMLLNNYDLWNKKDPECPWSEIVGVQMACAAMKGNIDFWMSLVNHYTLDPELEKAGKILYEQFLTTVKDVKEAPTTQIVEHNGKKTVVFFCEQDISLMSDAIYTDPEIAPHITVCLFRRDGKWVASFRTPDGDTYQVNKLASAIAVILGTTGGGHRAAAGVSFPPGEEDEVEIAQRFVGLLKQVL